MSAHLTVDEIIELTPSIPVPTWVKRVATHRLGHAGWTARLGHHFPYVLNVELTERQNNPYAGRVGGYRTSRETWQPAVNCPMPMAKNEDELRKQVMVAIFMSTGHEIFEIVGSGGLFVCDPHFTTDQAQGRSNGAGMHENDIAQWLLTLELLMKFVEDYADINPPKVLVS